MTQDQLKARGELEQLSDERLEIQAAALMRDIGGANAARRFRAASPTRRRCIDFLLKNTPRLPEV